MSKDFKSVLEVRTEVSLTFDSTYKRSADNLVKLSISFILKNLKQQKERRDKFSQGGVSDSITTASMPGTSGKYKLR